MRVFYKRLLSLGIAIGVFCALIVITVGQTRITEKRLRDSILDSNIYKLVYREDRNTINFIGLDIANEIISALPEAIISDVVAFSNGYPITYKDEPISNAVTLTATGSKYDDVMKLEFEKGRYFTEEEVDKQSKVCIIKSSVYKLIGMGAEEKININNEPYEIIGVIRDDSIKNVDDFEGDIYVPVTTLYTDIVETSENSGLVFKIILNKGEYSKNQILKEIVENVASDKYDISKLEMSINYESAFNTYSQLLRIFLILFIISLLVLVISALNIVHIATASIMDREREIGLRTALGASTGQIIKQICSEICACALHGGILGIAISGIFNTISNYYFKQFVWSFNIVTIGAGLLLATLAGLIASILPARRAAKLDPIRALREE